MDYSHSGVLYAAQSFDLRFEGLHCVSGVNWSISQEGTTLSSIPREITVKSPTAASKMAQVIATMSAVAVAVYSTWLTILAFAGGTAPIFRWHFDGGLVQGVLFLVIVEPLLVALAYWATIVVISPFLAVHAAIEVPRARKDPTTHASLPQAATHDSSVATLNQTLVSALREGEQCEALFPMQLVILRPGRTEDERVGSVCMFAVTNERILWVVDGNASETFWLQLAPDFLRLALRPGAMRLENCLAISRASPEAVEFAFPDQAAEWVALGAVKGVLARTDTAAVSARAKRRARFLELQLIPVADWETCPRCEQVISTRVESAALCDGCHVIFTDPDKQPVVSERSGDVYPQLVSVEPWYPITESDLNYQGRTLAWALFPLDRPMAAQFVIAHELVSDEP